MAKRSSFSRLNGRANSSVSRRISRVETLEARQLLAAEITGWVGSYYGSGTPDASPDLVRHDALIDFDWGQRSALNNTGDSDGSSARWESNLQSDHTATHQLILRMEPQDGLRVWVDNQIVVNAWNGAGSDEIIADVPLVADQATPVRIETRDISGASRLWLGWTSPELPVEVVGPEWTPLSTDQMQALDDAAPTGILFEQLSSVAGDFLGTGDVDHSAVTSGVRLSTIDASASGTTHPAQRTRGFFVPETSGDYQFRISGGDASRLLLADDGTPELSRVIASTDSATTPGQWNVDASQTSPPVALVAGVHYYLETRQVDSGSYDGLEVQWRQAGSAWEAIPNEQLRPLQAQIGVRAVVSAVSETDSSPTLSFDVSRTDDFGLDLVVQLHYGGTATRGSDYTGAPATVTIPAGQRSARVNINVVSDSVNDELETVEVSAASSSQYELSTPIRTRTTLTISGPLIPTGGSLIPSNPLTVTNIDEATGTSFANFTNRTANADGENDGTVNGTVLVVDTITTPPGASTVSARWNITQDVAASENVYVEFYYRRLGTLWSPMEFRLHDTLSFDDWGTTELIAKGFWQHAQIQIAAGQALSSSSLRAELAFDLAEDITDVEIANFQVRLTEDPLVPAQSFQNYPERDADSDWRWDAQQSVLENRRNELLVNVTNQAGAAVSGATVEVNQLQHSYGFGNIIRSEYISDVYSNSRTAESARHRAIASRLFNTLTIADGIRWRLWEINDNIGRQSVDWVNDNFDRLHGHHLTWGQFRLIPDSVEAEYFRLRDNVSQTAAREYLRTAQLEHVADIASELGGTIDGTDRPKIAHWDTVNHPVLLKELWNILRDGGSLAGPMGEVFDVAKANSHPDTLQMINEGQTIERVGIPRRTEYYDLIEELLDNGKPVEAIGFMNHFDLATAPSPTQFNAYLNEFAQLGLPLSMTEFDINSTGTDLQTQADWSEDYYLNVFANPATSFIIGYGFWESAHWRDEVGAHWYEADWEAKPNADVFVDQIFREWQTDTQGSTRTDGTYRTMAFDGQHQVTVTVGGHTYEAVVDVDSNGGVVDIQVDSPTVITDGTRIEAESYDEGGQGVAYHDTTTGNTGGQFRTDDVDIGANIDDGSPGFNVGWIAGGEWLHYTTDVQPGTYNVAARVASNNASAGDLKLLIGDGTSFTELGTFPVESTGGWGNWITVTLNDVDLGPHAGIDQVLRLEMVGGGFNLNWIEFNQEMDFGDAPQSYGTLLTDDGARHAAVGPQLGANRDTETDGIATPDADGDGSDDDGVMFGAINVDGTMAGVNIKLPADIEGQIDAWIDFNRNGSFDAGEKIIHDLSVNELEQTINYMIPTDIPGGITVGVTYARVRISSAGGLGPTGFAADGEVEDYVVSIVEPPQVESIVVNEGHSQRSSLDSVRITFDTVVDINQIDGNPFEITRAGSAGTLIPLVSIDDTSGKTVVDLSFAVGDSFVTGFGSLLDGDYQLRIDATLVTDRWVRLDGNRDGSAGDDYVMSATDGLFRMYGDANGSKSVGLTDFAAFRSVFGTSSSDANAMSGLDSDGDGDIGLTDFAAFRANFGT
ncbi:Exoglucanase/xylanase precursor [Rubripirellula obstinata]|uniref:endo-1,4-beta-xylanase n=1 Tax=Rubripirellula obstinata TaxID=406547 RepID=A0A5B1CIX4_9BACT|nr:endo-1,4-beta-xylanase [Rubripirellula obstinata]KAA1259865.1 Exoglucanase/xylanase precursor [Rubripirellula obstinata]